MIQRLRGLYSGKKIAVVASGPTASEYHGDCDISIAVNGAALLPHHFNYFICGDIRSPSMNWFHTNCSDVRIIADLVATCDKRLFPQSLYPSLKRVATHQQRKEVLDHIPDPVSPHLVFSFEPFVLSNLTRYIDYLMYGGTMSCGALQLAWIMGGSKIDIYGCPFTHTNGSYFYHCTSPGSVSSSQLKVMQAVIDFIRKDTEVSIIGESLLK